MAAPDREIVITYGGYSVGGSTGREIDGKIRIEDAFDRGAVEFTVVIASDTQANFATACLALEAAYRDPYGTLSITMGGQTFLNFDADDALEAMPTVTKEGGVFDTGLSRAYRVRIDYGRPADNVPDSGLRRRAVTITYTPARQRTVTIEGVYTAVSGTNARAKYEAGIASLATTVLDAVDNSANWELVDETSGPSSTNDKTVTFSRSYEEILYSQAGSADSSAIVRQSLVIKLRDVAPGDTPESRRLGTYDVTYSAWIDKETTQDLAAQWAIIQPWLITQVQSASNVSQVAVVDREVSYDYNANRIEARMVFQGASGDDRIENTIEVEDEDKIGLVHLPVWSGNAIDRLEYQGPRDYMRTVTSRTVFLGDRGIAFSRSEINQLLSDHSSSPPASAAVPGGQWRILNVRSKPKRERRGLTDVSTTFIFVTVVETTGVMQWINRVTGSDAGPITPSGAGGGGAVTP